MLLKPRVQTPLKTFVEEFKLLKKKNVSVKVLSTKPLSETDKIKLIAAIKYGIYQRMLNDSFSYPTMVEVRCYLANKSLASTLLKIEYI